MTTDASSTCTAEPAPSTSEPPPRTIKRFRRFALRVFLIFAPVHLYVGVSLLPDLPIGFPAQVLGGVVLAVSTVIIPYGTLASMFFRDPDLVDRLVWIGAVTMGLFSSVLIFTLLRDIAMVFPDLTRWRSESALLVLALAGTVTLVGYVNARRVARVVRVEIPLDDLPPALDGLTIAQLSDIHVGSTIKADYVRGIVERTNALEPDVIAITGDVVDGKVERLLEDVRPLSRLRARQGPISSPAITSTTAAPRPG